MELVSESGTLHIFCGKMAAGKSTLAAHLAQEGKHILLSEDALLHSLYPGQVTDLAAYIRCTDRLKQALGAHICAILRSGASVVLDFPGNTQSQRRWLVGLAETVGASHQLHYLPRTDEVCKRQLAQRAFANPDRRTTDTVEVFEAMRQYFEPPLASERLNVFVHDDPERQMS